MPNHNVATLALLLGFSFSPFFHASDPILPGDTDLIRDRQERLLQDQQKRLDELRQLPNNPALAKPELTDETRCFEVKDINLQGATRISASTKSKLLKPFTSQCLGAKNIDALLKSITGYYLNRGYVTSRAYLPEQDLTSGILQVMVIEGKLQGFEVSELASKRELAMTFPSKNR